ncbi:MAG: hypothetical protein EBQ89_07285 [Alphaproteobacteria bacterium]|nr:hypothetical protein [Alphaproteobacteria bacterium]
MLKRIGNKKNGKVGIVVANIIDNNSPRALKFFAETIAIGSPSWNINTAQWIIIIVMAKANKFSRPTQ